MNIGIDSVLGKAKDDEDVLAVIVYGSAVRGEDNRDVDVCVVLKPREYDKITLSEKKLEYAKEASAGVDVQVYQQLPAYIRERVIMEGKVEYTVDEATLFDLAVDTHRMFEDFKPIYDEYLKGVADA
jgi:predicted nucleotidyltransferase